MNNWLWNFRKEKLTQKLAVAIFWKDVPKVKTLLDKGADPNGLDIGGRRRFLARAMECQSLPVVELLLDAGADPRQPYVMMGVEFRLSEAARIYGYEEIADRFLAAEREAAEKWGAPDPIRVGLNLQLSDIARRTGNEKAALWFEAAEQMAQSQKSSRNRGRPGSNHCPRHP